MVNLPIDEYLTRKKDIQGRILEYLDNKNDNDENYQIIIKYFEDQKIHENQSEFRLFLRLLIKLSKYHYRSPAFYTKIDKLIFDLKDRIKQTFSNSDIYSIFKGNKRILLYLIKQNILTIEKSLVAKMKVKKYQNYFYLNFLYPEARPFIDRILRRTIEEKNIELTLNFDENRLKGENDSKICQLIQSDSLDEFISYTNEHSVLLTTKVKSSIFETNGFLLKNSSRLIEYSAFKGSFKIFNYILSQNIELDPSIWLYAVHGQNIDIIRLIEQRSVKLDEKNSKECLIQAIKCHSNDIVKYLIDHYFDGKISDVDALSACIKYCNNMYFPEKINNEEIFFEICKYNYFPIVISVLKNEEIDVNKKIICRKF